eukprot:3131109-Alexandrium_andersonii.AAC.1
MQASEAQFSPDGLWPMHDAETRPLFLLDDLKKFDGKLPHSWRMDCAVDPHRHEQWFRDHDLQIQK